MSLYWHSPFPFSAADHRATLDSQELRRKTLQLAAPLAHALMHAAWFKSIEVESADLRWWLHDAVLELSTWADQGRELEAADAAQLFLVLDRVEEWGAAA